MKYEKRMPIASWAEEDRPREKLLAWGKSRMTDAELLAILLGSGNQNCSAVDLAKKILHSINNEMANCRDLSLIDLSKFKGVGPAKAALVIAALEFGKRAYHQHQPVQKQITCSSDSFGFLRNHIADLDHEEFWILLLSRSNRVISTQRIGVGGVSSTVVDPKIVFSKALEKLASSIVLAHNHPSGNLRPSVQDISLTTKLCKAGEFLDIRILDHLILSSRGYFSFADEGLIKSSK